jgi:hypothetical protein
MNRRGCARESYSGFKGGNWQAMPFHAAKKDWHAFCVREHSKDDLHPGPPPPCAVPRAPTTSATLKPSGAATRSVASGATALPKSTTSTTVPSAATATASTASPASASAASWTSNEPNPALESMLAGMSVTEENPIDPFRRSYYVTSGHVYLTE